MDLWKDRCLKGLGKKKWVLTLALFGVGAAIALLTGATLESWTMFTMALLGTFGAADVADKKLNGGAYNE